MEQQLLETQYQQAATIEKAATEIMQQQNTDVKRQKAASGNDFTAGFAQLLTVITNAQKMQLEATMKGRGIDSSDAIQMPTYSTRPVSPGPLIMAAAMGLIAGLLLLVLWWPAMVYSNAHKQVQICNDLHLINQSTHE